MLQRVLIHFSLILLFAFTQMGVATHSISHLANSNEQQQDQNNTEHQCGQCISLTHAADVNLTQSFNFTVTPAEYIFVANELSGVATALSFSYSARAPPQYSQA
jgi:hypothetical protein